MSRPPSLHIEHDTTPALDSTQSSPQQQQRPNSLTPSPRRERPPLRSSPLAGPSYASDGAGGIVERSSALEEEIARRKSLLVAGLDDAELARLGALSHSPTNSLSISGKNEHTPPVPSRQNSSDSSIVDGHDITHRKARPSFISLAPPLSPSQSSLQLPAPPATLRNRHSSPNIARAASLDAPSPPVPAAPTTGKTADWMTSAPSPSFSRSSIHARGIVLPVKADSKSGQRIRRKSMPSQIRRPPAPVPPLPVPGQIRMAETGIGRNNEMELDMDIEGRGQGQSIRAKKSARSLRSFFRHDHEEKERELPLVPPLPHSAHSRSRASSISGASIQMPPTPADSAVHLPSTQVPLDRQHHHEPEGKVKRLWARVKHGVKRVK